MADSLPALLRAVEEQAEEHRVLDLCLVLRRKQTGETLLEAGGRWDCVDRRWLDQEPEQARFFDLGESQVEFTRWLAGWLADFRGGHERQIPRQVVDRLVLAESGRRAGKTTGLLAGLAAVAVDMPQVASLPLVTWVISKSHEEEDEVHAALKQILPSHWYRWRERKRRYELAHGAAIHLISSDRPHTTKRGRVDLALVNEAQKQRQAALTNLIYGTADRGGLTLLAANPNDSLSGEWVAKLRTKILDQELPRCRSFYFDPSLNPFVDQAARSDVDAIVRVIDPSVAQRDGGGEWLPVGDRTYYDFDRKRCVQPAPQLGDITREFTRRRLGRAYDFVAGFDPNARPHMVAVVGKFFGKIEDPTLVILKEIVEEHAHEDEFLDEVDSLGYTPEQLHWVLDQSSWWQDSERRRNGSTSHDFFKRRRWVCKPPETKKSTRGEFAANPRPVGRRYGLTNRLLKGNDDGPRTLIDPSCSWLIESLKECRFKKTDSGGKAIGKHAHITDALGYLQWFWFPRPEKPRSNEILAANVQVPRPSYY